MKLAESLATTRIALGVAGPFWRPIRKKIHKILLFSARGQALVALKARPGQPLWPAMRKGSVEKADSPDLPAMNRLLISSLIMLGLFGLRSAALSLASPPLSPEPGGPLVLSRSAGTDEVLAYARSLLGSPYRGGGCTPGGFDCSGFVQHVFAESGYVLPRSSRAMARACQPVEIAEAVPGDLLFFAGRDGDKTRIGHVALLLSRQGQTIEMIHATDRGVVIDQLNRMPYYQKRLTGAGKPPLEKK